MKRYSFKDTIMVINGLEVTGWAEGDDAITIERRADSATDKVGAGGEMMVSISADRSGSVKIKLQQTSSSNKWLMAMLALQEAGCSSFVPIACMFQDTYRNDLAAGTSGYLKKPPSMTRGAEAGTQEWEVIVERLDLLFGDVF